VRTGGEEGAESQTETGRGRRSRTGSRRSVEPGFAHPADGGAACQARVADGRATRFCVRAGGGRRDLPPRVPSFSGLLSPLLLFLLHSHPLDCALIQPYSSWRHRFPARTGTAILARFPAILSRWRTPMDAQATPCTQGECDMQLAKAERCPDPAHTGRPGDALW
jgi:hypothetical protein